MSTNVIITGHARERIEQRITPLLGDRALEEIHALVLDAEWNQRYRRRCPKWLRRAVDAPCEQHAYVTARIAGVRVACVVVRGRGGEPPRLVTVITDTPVATSPLPRVPVLADGRVIGRPRTAPLPVAFAA